MRKTLAIFQASPRRLLTLLLITYLVAVAAGNPRRPCIRLNGKTTVSEAEYQLAVEKVASCSKGLRFEQEYQFISRSSNYFVEIRPSVSKRRVAARGWSSKGRYTHLIMTSQTCPDNKHIVWIKGKKRDNSLCFTKNGILIQKPNRNWNVRCAFYERSVQGPGYAQIELVSAFNPNFAVAFNHHGRRLRGGRYSGRCNHIIKLGKRRDKIDDWHLKTFRRDGRYQSAKRQRHSIKDISKQRNSRPRAQKQRHLKKTQRGYTSQQKQSYSPTLSRRKHGIRHVRQKTRRSRWIRMQSNNR